MMSEMSALTLRPSAAMAPSLWNLDKCLAPESALVSDNAQDSHDDGTPAIATAQPGRCAYGCDAVDCRRRAQEQAVMRGQPARHAQRLVVRHALCRVNERQSELYIVRKSVHADTLDHRIDLVATTCALCLCLLYTSDAADE